MLASFAVTTGFPPNLTLQITACHLYVQMQGLDLNEDDEKKLVDGIFSSAVDCLSGKVELPVE